MKIDRPCHLESVIPAMACRTEGGSLQGTLVYFVETALALSLVSTVDWLAHDNYGTSENMAAELGLRLKIMSMIWLCSVSLSLPAATSMSSKCGKSRSRT